MKKLILLAIIFIHSIAFAQLVPSSTTKICLDEDQTSVGGIGISNNILVNSINSYQSLVGYDITTGSIKWTKKYSKQYYIGYGLYKYGNNLMFSSNSNTYDAKGNVTMSSSIFTIDPQTGNKIDSVKCNYDVVYLSDSPAKSGYIGVVRQTTGYKYGAALISKKDGTVKYELLKEDGKTADIAVCISVDQSEKYVAVGTANGKKGIFIYDFVTGKQLANFPGTGDVHNIVFSSDSKNCFYVQAKKLNVINLETLKLEKQITLMGDLYFTAIHSDDKNLALTGYGNGAPVTFLDWKTEKIHTTKISTTGRNCYFDNNGNFFAHSLKNSFSCKVDPINNPYLVMFKIGEGNNSNQTTEKPVSSDVNEYSIGSRVFIYHSGNKKYYSGTILEVNSTGYNIAFDEGTHSKVSKSDVKNLPPLKAGTSVQAIRKDKKPYVGTISEIRNDAALVKFAAEIIEWIPLRNIMQVE